MTLVERSEALRELALSLDAVGTGSVVLIEGPATTGKTALLQAFADRAVAAGAVYLGAAASVAERDLPLSTAGEIFQHPALTAAESEQVELLLADGVLAASTYCVGADPVTSVPVPILRRLSQVLLEIAERALLVVGVDDIHHADAASLRFLLYLASRMRGSRVLLVLTECVGAVRAHPLLHADLLRRPGARRVRLRPLSVDGVAELLAAHLDASPTQRLVRECYDATGGNPLLVHALIEDHRASGSQPSDCLIFGDTFRQSVLTCLYRSQTTALARGMAVLGRRCSLVLLGELTRLGTESIGALRATGLLDGDRFRHDAVPAAVLSGMRPYERAELYVRAAELMHGRGAPATDVAGCLMAAGQAPGSWAVAALRDAAEQAHSDGRFTDAVGYLRLAFREAADDQRHAVLLDLARAGWRIDPATVAGHLPELTRGLREGRLPASVTATLVGWMLWLGRVSEALETIDVMGVETGRPQCGTELQPETLRLMYPGLAWPESVPGDGSAPVTAPPSAQIDGTIMATLAYGAHGRPLDHVERILRDSRPVMRGAAPLAALATLIYTDELDRAARWCDKFDRSEEARPPLAEALLAALRALVHSRRGELKAAEKCGGLAFSHTTPKGWGVVVGLPLGNIMLVLTAMGKYEMVENHFDTLVPDAIFHTPFALPYLQARGRYYLAINRPQAALAEFEMCGTLASRWGFDIPSFVPWRTEMAKAHLAMGNRKDARLLAAEQLGHVKDRHLRTRGLTLRTLAMASGPAQRVGTLATAAELLERAGDRLELAYALADLSGAYEAAGQAQRARVTEQRARLLAAECGADDLGAALAHGLDDTPSRAGADADPLAKLSEAERRVAALAADGHTNRQIARRLHVTVSTVEQHLTHVYRKLDINRRTNLPLKLLFMNEDSSA